MFGYNGEIFEIGGSAFWGLALNKASYEGWWYYYRPAGLPITPDTENFERVKYKDISILHSYGGLVAYASFYWEKFALNYAASFTYPWLGELPAKGYDADISFGAR